MNVCYSALFGQYEEVKEPRVITPGWTYILYTDQPVTSNVWEIKHIPLNGFEPQLLARFFKIMEWVDWERSMWVDSSFMIDTDLNEWWDKYFQKGFAAPNHPLRNCVYNECLDCIIAQRGDKVQVQDQMAEYRQLGIPANNGLIQSGLLMRENSEQVIKLCESWWKELSSHSIRDQISFCKASIPFKEIIHTYNFDYRAGKDFIYFHHYTRRGGAHVPMHKI